MDDNKMYIINEVGIPESLVEAGLSVDISENEICKLTGDLRKNIDASKCKNCKYKCN